MKELSTRTDAISERARKNLSILDTIRRSGPISKTDISSIIGVNVVTVSNYVEEFLRQKLIFEKELDVSKGGRRPVLLDFNAEAGYAIGVGLNLLNLIAVIVDMKGRLIEKVTYERPQTTTGDISEVMSKLINELLDKNPGRREKLKGIGIGIAGIVDHKRETVRWPEKTAQGYSYTSITLPLKEIVEKEFHLPVRIDNDATLACFGEQWLAHESDIRDVLYMFSGVGCGIMVNGELYRGASGCAGEVSIFSSKEKDELSCTGSDRCVLRRWELDLGMLEFAKKQLPQRKDSKIWQLCGNSLDNVHLKDIFEAARADDLFALSVVKGCARRLGVKVAFLVNLFNPQVVIIGGGLEEAGMPLIEEVRHAVTEYAFEEASSAVKIVPSRLGENAVALGAANLIVREVLANT